MIIASLSPNFCSGNALVRVSMMNSFKELLSRNLVAITLDLESAHSKSLSHTALFRTTIAGYLRSSRDLLKLAFGTTEERLCNI